MSHNLVYLDFIPSRRVQRVRERLIRLSMDQHNTPLHSLDSGSTYPSNPQLTYGRTVGNRMQEYKNTNIDQLSHHKTQSFKKDREISHKSDEPSTPRLLSSLNVNRKRGPALVAIPGSDAARRVKQPRIQSAINSEYVSLLQPSPATPTRTTTREYPETILHAPKRPVPRARISIDAGSSAVSDLPVKSLFLELNEVTSNPPAQHSAQEHITFATFPALGKPTPGHITPPYKSKSTKAPPGAPKPPVRQQNKRGLFAVVPESSSSDSSDAMSRFQHSVFPSSLSPGGAVNVAVDLSSCDPVDLTDRFQQLIAHSLHGNAILPKPQLLPEPSMVSTPSPSPSDDRDEYGLTTTLSDHLDRMASPDTFIDNTQPMSTMERENDNGDDDDGLYDATESPVWRRLDFSPRSSSPSSSSMYTNMGSTQMSSQSDVGDVVDESFKLSSLRPHLTLTDYFQPTSPLHRHETPPEPMNDDDDVPSPVGPQPQTRIPHMAYTPDHQLPNTADQQHYMETQRLIHKHNPSNEIGPDTTPPKAMPVKRPATLRPRHIEQLKRTIGFSLLRRRVMDAVPLPSIEEELETTVKQLQKQKLQQQQPFDEQEDEIVSSSSSLSLYNLPKISIDVTQNNGGQQQSQSQSRKVEVAALDSIPPRTAAPADASSSASSMQSGASISTGRRTAAAQANKRRMLHYIREFCQLFVASTHPLYKEKYLNGAYRIFQGRQTPNHLTLYCQDQWSHQVLQDEEICSAACDVVARAVSQVDGRLSMDACTQVITDSLLRAIP